MKMSPSPLSLPRLAAGLAGAALLVSAAFWGLFPHTAHCRLVRALGARTCPTHAVHLLMGLVSYLAAVVVTQWAYLTGFLR